MQYVINDRLAFSQVPEGPLAVYLGPFAESLSQQGKTQRYVHRQVMLAACFSRWLKQTEVSSQHITSEPVAQYLAFRYRRRRPNQGDPAVLGHFIEFLRCERLISAEKVSTR